MTNMTEDRTPLPGELVPNDIAKPIIADFLSSYRVHTEGRPNNIPTWCTFPQGRVVDEMIFGTPFFLKYTVLYFYFENAKSLYKASSAQIKDFFDNRNPWEDKDYYIFNTGLDWCIAATHEGDTILVGNVAHPHFP